MRRIIVWLGPALGLALAAALGAGASAQSSTSTTQTRQFEIVSVDGNKVVVKGAEGAREITVPPDFKLTVDGRAVGVSELRPGMKGTATITTTTTTTPVVVTEVKNGRVFKVSGNSIVVRTDDGLKMFSEADVARRNVKIMRDGQPLAFTDLREGDTLSATIVTTNPPKVVTERNVEAALTSARSAAGAAVASGAAAVESAAATTATATGAAASNTARTLPKTASPFPLVGVTGVTSLGIALLLAAVRRRRE